MTEIFKKPTISGLAQFVRETREDKYASIKPAPPKDYYVLSAAQKRLYVHHQMNLNSSVYNMTEFIILEKDVEKERIEDTFRKLIQRHEILRTAFEMVEGCPLHDLFPQLQEPDGRLWRGAHSAKRKV